MSNSSLVTYTKISPNKTTMKNKKNSKITIHHMAGNLSVESCGNIFAKKERKASSNYAVDTNGKVAMYVEEKDRSWCSSSRENDEQAVTIEVANDEIGGIWHVSDTAYYKLIELCVDICKRNDIKKLRYDGTKNGSLTIHSMFKNTACPGPYLKSKLNDICTEVNKRLTTEDAKSTVYIVQKGDNLTKIAKMYNKTVDYLVKLNNIKNKNLIYVGQKIKID